MKTFTYLFCALASLQCHAFGEAGLRPGMSKDEAITALRIAGRENIMTYDAQDGRGYMEVHGEPTEDRLEFNHNKLCSWVYHDPAPSFRRYVVLVDQFAKTRAKVRVAPNVGVTAVEGGDKVSSGLTWISEPAMAVSYSEYPDGRPDLIVAHEVGKCIQ